MANEHSSQDTPPSAEVTSQVLPSGYELDEYIIDKEIGSGGFGVTYKARDKHLDRIVAIKEYFPFSLATRGGEWTVSPKTRVEKDVEEYQWGLSRFIEEARILARFEHPNIIRVIRYIEKNSTAYIIMDYAEGQDLAATLQHQGKLSVEAVKDIVLPIAEGLINVHDVEMLHRDIKPGNIRIKANGDPILIDFGAARQAIGARSKSISTILTPGYAPIEQYSTRGNQGPWTDIYALAAVAYVCLTHENLSHFEATERIRKDTLTKLTNRIEHPDQAFLAALDWALEPDEEQRPKTVADWIAAMKGVNPVGASESASNNEKTQRIEAPTQRAEEIKPASATETAGYCAFISYASGDKDKAFKICEGLERRGVSCWIAPRNVRAGKEYTEEIIRGLDRSGHVVLVLSDAANQSIFVKREVERAISYNKPVFPVRIEDVMPSASLELLISSSHWIDAWQGKLGNHIDQLARDLLDDDDEPVSIAPSIASAKAAGGTKSSKLPMVAIALVGLCIAGLIAYMGMNLGQEADNTQVVNAPVEPPPKTVAKPEPIEKPKQIVAAPKTTAPPAPAPVAVNSVQDQQDFNTAKLINTPEAFELYLRLHPQGRFRQQAQQFRQQLR